MNKRKINLLVLILSIILIFIIGVIYEIDYRILTRKSIRFFSNHEIDYYGGKEFRFFVTDSAAILALIPICLYTLIKDLALLTTKFKITLLFLITIPFFYCLYCYTEVQLIKMTVTNPTYINGSLMYHSNNIDYRGILFFTIVSAFLMALAGKKMNKKNTIIK